MTLFVPQEDIVSQITSLTCQTTGYCYIVPGILLEEAYNTEFQYHIIIGIMVYIPPSIDLSYGDYFHKPESPKMRMEFALQVIFTGTVLVLIKLTKFAVTLRLRCGSCKFKF